MREIVWSKFSGFENRTDGGRFDGRRISHVVVLGTGWGEVVEALNPVESFDYADFAFAHNAELSGHARKLVVCQPVKRKNKFILVFQGRPAHFYENPDDWSPIVAPAVVAGILGASLVLTNAAGASQKQSKVGSFVLIKDLFPFNIPSPLFGMPHFHPMTGLVDEGMLKNLKKAMRQKRVAVQEGIYTCVPGPHYETAAMIEVFAKLLRMKGRCNVVGMSTYPEWVVARAGWPEAGDSMAKVSFLTNTLRRGQNAIPTVGISCVTNLGAGLGGTIDYKHVEAEVAKASEQAAAFLKDFFQLELA